MPELRQENKNLRLQVECLKSSVKNALEDENKKLRQSLEEANRKLESFLNPDQIKSLSEGRIGNWTNDSIVKGLKFRFALSVRGYEFLRSTGYPLPGYSTLNRRIQNFKLNFGIFNDIMELLRYKVESMSPEDRYCVISYDEMVISGKKDYDKNEGVFVGNATLGDNRNCIGEKLFLVLVRGIRSPWKQIIASHVMPKTRLDPLVLKEFILDCVRVLEQCGLYVVLLSSDLDSRNRSLWTSMGITVDKLGNRVNSFKFNGHDIYLTPDVWHVVKNLKSSCLRQRIFLPDAYVEKEGLPSNIVLGSYVKQLWNYEMENELEIRRLFHLRSEDVDPSQFDKMNVGAAIRFFSLQTATALECAINENTLPKDALSTAHFIRVIYEWYSILTSKIRKTSITARNCDRKYIFLHTCIELFHNIVFEKNWKPLNYAGVLATLTFADVAEFLFKNRFDFFLGQRCTQDATENVFSQVRKKAGKMPSALESLRALRQISLSQFVSEIKNTNYCNDVDKFLRRKSPPSGS